MRKIKDTIAYTAIIGSIIASVLILLVISGFVFYQGVPKIDQDFIFNQAEDQWFYIEMTPEELDSLNVATDEEGNVVIQEDNPNSFHTLNNETINLNEGDVVLSVNGEDPAEISAAEYEAMFNGDENIEVKVEKVGGGIWPMIVTTLFTVIMALAFALPLGIGTAIFLTEYTNSRSRVNRWIHSAIDNLAGIPSIIFGLFGMIFFVTFLGFGYSLIAATLTLTIMLMPTIIRTTEEALKAVPNSLREASYGLGVSKVTTIFKVVIPSAMSGIVVAIILSAGRVIGESAILLFTAGTVAQIPTSIYDSAATLTIQSYLYAKEFGDIASACAIGVIIIIIVIILNILAKVLAKKLSYDMRGN